MLKSQIHIFAGVCGGGGGGGWRPTFDAEPKNAKIPKFTFLQVGGGGGGGGLVANFWCWVQIC